MRSWLTLARIYAGMTVAFDVAVAGFWVGMFGALLGVMSRLGYAIGTSWQATLVAVIMLAMLGYMYKRWRMDAFQWERLWESTVAEEPGGDSY